MPEFGRLAVSKPVRIEAEFNKYWQVIGTEKRKTFNAYRFDVLGKQNLVNRKSQIRP